MSAPLRQLAAIAIATGLFAGDLSAQRHELGQANLRMVDETAALRDVRVHSIGQLPDGRMLLGALDAIYVHDGHRAQRIEVPGPSGPEFKIRGTAEGDILVASSSSASLIRPRESAEVAAWDVQTWDNATELFSDFDYGFALRRTGQSWTAVASSRGASLHGDEWIAWPSNREGETRHWISRENIHRLVGDRSLQFWNGDQWVDDRILDRPLTEAVWAVDFTTGNTINVITEGGQAYRINASGVVSRRWSARDLVAEFKLRSATWLPDGGSVLISQDSRLMIVDAAGALAAFMDENSGLPKGVISAIFVDRAGTIWGTLNDRLFQIELPTHVTRFEPAAGLVEQNVLSLVRHKTQLFAGTSDGVYRLELGMPNARFVPVPGPRSATPSLLSHQDTLFAAGTDGVFIWQDYALQSIATPNGQATLLHPSRHDPNIIYVGTTLGVGRLQKTREGWGLIDSPNNSNRIRSFLETGPHEWWSIGPNSGIIKIMPAPPRPVRDPNAQLPAKLMPSRPRVMFLGQPTINNYFAPDSATASIDSHASLHRWGNVNLKAGNTGLHQLGDPPTPVALLDAATRAILIDGNRQLHVFEPQNDELAWLGLRPNRAAAGSGMQWQVRQSPRTGERPHRILPAAAHRVGEIQVLLSETGPLGEVLWVGGDRGLSRINLTNLPSPAAPAQPRLERVGDQLAVSTHTPLPADHDSIGFTFATPGSIDGRGLSYRTRLLKSKEGAWSPFQPAAQREFGRLAPGDYHFEVQSRNADGLTSPVNGVSFAVSPPWWFTPTGIAFELLAALTLIWGCHRWLVRRHRMRQAHLEALVAERTVALRASEHQLSTAKDEAERANRAKSTFLAAMSHELRTPLNAILGFAQILRREDRLSDKGHSQLEVIDRNGQHLLATINDVLDLSKIEADKMTLHPSSCSLRQVARVLADTFRLRTVEKDLQFRLEFDERVPTAVIADEAKLRQVLINLLANAVKFTPAGSITLAIDRMENSANATVRFTVTDTGIGIPATEQSRVFDAFHQNETASTPPVPGGTGLGLSISQRLVRLMGGEIQLTDNPTGGCRFSFSLPLPPAPASPTTHSPRQITGYVGPRRSVLVVDDIATNRSVLREMLQPVGFEIREAVTGEEALAHHHDQPAELVLLDLRLTGLTGRETAERLRQSDHPPRIIAVSASVLGQPDVLAHEAACDAFISKPVNEAKLFEVVGAQLGLEWTHTERPSSATENSPPTAPLLPMHELVALPLPPVDLLAAWLKLARGADMRAIRTELAKIEPSASGSEFCAQLDQLARQFRTSAVSNALVAALEHSSTHPPASS